MGEPQRTQSSLQTSPRASRLLQSLSHLKRVVRFPGRKTSKGDRDAQHTPYLSHPPLEPPNLIIEPFSSQSHLALGRSLNANSKPATDFSPLRRESASMSSPTGARQSTDSRDKSYTPISPLRSPDALGITYGIDMSPNVQQSHGTPTIVTGTSNPTSVIPHTQPTHHIAKSIASVDSQLQPADLHGSSTRSSASDPSWPLQPLRLSSVHSRSQVPSGSDVTSQASSLIHGYASEPTATISESTITGASPSTSTSAVYPDSPPRYQTMYETLPSTPTPLPKPPLPENYSRIPPQPPKLMIPPTNPRIGLTRSSQLGSARLSPTVIARHPPLPIRNLPTLPVATSKPDVRDAGDQQKSSARRRSQLRSMPSLPLRGAAIDVTGQEEADEGEGEDEEEEDIDDEDSTEGEGETEGETSQTESSSRPDFLVPGASEDAPSFSNNNKINDYNRRIYRGQSKRPSTSPSHHTAISDISSVPHNGRQQTHVVQRKQPPRSLPPIPLQHARPQVPGSHPHKPEDHQQHAAHSQEVDIPRLDMSFLSRSPMSSPTDSKGKGKARGPSEDSLDSRTPTASNLSLGGHAYHETQTPKASRGHHLHDHFSGPTVAEEATPGSRRTYITAHDHAGLSNPSSLRKSFLASSTQLWTPPQVDSLRSPLLSQAPTRSSTVVNPKAQRSKSIMYGVTSHSMVDLRTIETKEQKRKLEEEVRMEEKEELNRKRTIVGLKGQHKRDTGKQVKKEDEDEKEGGIRDDTEIWETDTVRAPMIPPSPTAAGNAVVDDSKPAKKPSSRPSTAASHYLRRRRSMPMFDASSEPPPYPLFAPHYPKQRISPRDDEGKERLPPYTNGIYLKAIMPRKMEFTKPGVQATDRKWRRVMCVLEGTVLRVYKCPLGRAGVGLLGEWWEKQVGAGDVSLQPSHSGGVSNIQIETRQSRRLAEEQREVERQIARILKAEGTGETSPIEGAATTFPVPTLLLPQSSAQPSSQQAEQTASTSSKSRFSQLLKPGRVHARSRSEQVLVTSAAHTPASRPSLNVRGNSEVAPPSEENRMSLSTVNERGEVIAPSTSRNSMFLSATTPFPTPSISSGSFTTQSSRGFLSSVSAPFVSRENSSSVPQSNPQEGLQANEATPKPRMLYTNREIDFLPDPEPGDLIREYTMQHAESGLGHDYTKRRNVLRVRLEGEQFLLQARDVTGVIEWIEALQAATNIALDLDERSMPRGPLFPRRRRRRRPQTGNNAIQETDESQTGVAAEGGEGIMEAAVGANIFLAVHI